jgi:hypothetical protein
MMSKRTCRHALALAATAGLASVAAPVLAASIIALPDGKRATLQAALAEAQASAVPTVVVLPAGQWDYGSGGVEVDELNNVVILGAGAEHTRLYRSVCHGGAILRVNQSENLRITGINFDGCDATSTDVSAVGVHLWDAKNFRVDHCSFRQHSWAAVRIHGEHSNPRGVVDHCTFEHIFQGKHEGYGVAVTNDDEFLHEPFGSPKATFIEDSTFDRTRHAASANGAGRYVFRYNTVTRNENSHAVDAHGAEGASQVGTEWVEIYKNRIEQPVYNVAAVRIRGGKALVWGNEVSGYPLGVSLWEETGVPTGPVRLWGNDFGGAQAVGDVRGNPSWDTGKPAGYEPYAYPHPLVTDLEPEAGLDQKVTVDADGLGRIYVDASSSRASSGTIVGYRWYDGAQLVSSCARAVLALEQKSHVLVLETERSDGLREYDTTVVRAFAHAPVASSKSWRDRWFVPIVAQGTIDFDVTPSSAAMNGYVGFTGRRQVDSHADLAIRVRFAADGTIDAGHGDAGWSAANHVAYQSNQTHHVTISVDLATHRFGVTVDGVLLAESYPFEADVQTIGQMALWHASGALKVENLVVGGTLAQPDPGCMDSASSGGSEESGPAAGGAGAGADPSSGAGGLAEDADPEAMVALGDEEELRCSSSLPGSPSMPGSWWPIAAAVGLGSGAARRRRRAAPSSNGRTRTSLPVQRRPAAPARPVPATSDRTLPTGGAVVNAVVR